MSGDDEMVEVFHFRVYDPVHDEIKVMPSKRIAASIKEIGAELIPGTSESVRKSDLDAHGRYYSKPRPS